MGGVVPERGRDVPVHRGEVRGILSRTSGFIARAGFTHSLTPARNCTYGCTYCYVPTLRIRGGLKRVDWERWGRHTTFKSNAAKLLRRQLRHDQIVYCSPLVDPYQPAERLERAMPPILRALLERPPSVVVLQTRGPLILRDLSILKELATRTRLRISFSLTTDSDAIRKLYEPHCESVSERAHAMKTLADAGLAVHCTLAPILPCDPRSLADLALESTSCAVIADPLHTRSGKPAGATTRRQALRISHSAGFEAWHQKDSQDRVVEVLRTRVEAAGREFGVGEEGFRLLAA